MLLPNRVSTFYCIHCDLTMIAVETKICKFISFRTTGCYVQVLSNTEEK